MAAQQRTDTDSTSLPIDVQKLILDVSRRAFPFDHGGLDLKATIQKVKGYLFQRDFARAFANPKYLESYTRGVTRKHNF